MANDLALQRQPVVDWSLPAVSAAPPAGRPRALLGGGPGDNVLRFPGAAAAGLGIAPPGGTQAPSAAQDLGKPAGQRINPTRRELRFVVPLSDGDVYLGDIELAVSPQDDLAVDAPRLLELVRPLLLRDVATRLEAAVTAQGRLDEAGLAREGIRLIYNSQTLALAIDIPVARRLPRSLSLRSGPDAQQETLKPARFSGYLNLRAALELAERGSNRGNVVPTALVESAVRVRGLVAESDGYLSGRPGEPVFRRTASRLVYEDRRHAMRWTLGDTQFAARDFQSTASVLALSVSRIYSQIDPQREIRSSGAQSFTVTSPSMIETFVNGRSVERRQFQPGNYTLRDFPLAEGSNTVQLRIEDPTGRVRTVDFSIYANQTLLARGLTEFSLMGGVYSTPTARGIAYGRHWTSAGFVRRGISEKLTAGINFQGDRAVRQLGAEVLWGSPIGLAGFNLARRDTVGVGASTAGRLSFEWLVSSLESARRQSLMASVELRSRRFDVIDPAFTPERSRIRASLGYVVSTARNGYIAFNGQYSDSYGIRNPSYGARLSGGLDLGEQLTATGELGHLRGSFRNETYLRLGLRVRLGGRTTVQADSATNGDARLGISASGGTGTGAWNTAGEISRTDRMLALAANAGLLANRVELGLQQSASYDERINQVTDARTTVHAAFALAFAGNGFAVGRPVTDSFLIARPHRSLKRARIYLDPSERGDSGHSGTLGAALNGAITAHAVRTLIYQAPDAPAGYDLGAGNVTIRPPYRAGYDLVIGSDYHLLVIGRLVDATDEPISLIAGRAIDLGNPKRPAITVFTARDGRFAAQGLRPGRWRIEMPTEPQPSIFEFTVADSPDGTVRTGQLRPIPQERKQQ